MKQMVQFLNIYKKYKDKYNEKCQFIIVYINEAHANDRWKLNGNYEINYHKTLNQRFNSFKLLFKDIINLINNDNDCDINSIQEMNEMKFILDSMIKFKNLDYAFNAYPERIVALKNNRIVHRFGGPGPVPTIINKGYDINELQRFLNAYFDE